MITVALEPEKLPLLSGGKIISQHKLVADSLTNKVVTVFTDDNKKYLSTNLFKDIDNNKDFISNKVKLLDYKIV